LNDRYKNALIDPIIIKLRPNGDIANQKYLIHGSGFRKKEARFNLLGM